MADKATIDFLSDAKVGDMVWHFDGNRNRCVEGKYQGRGVWELAEISAETRRSFTVKRDKFDRKAGYPLATGGFYCPHKIRGQKEYEAVVWMYQHQRKLFKAVEDCRDIGKLLKIAEIVGYSDNGAS